MQKLTMFILADCPYCKLAFRLHEELFAAHPEYAAVEIEVIDEEVHPEISAQYDYYYVPCYFLGEERLFSGVPTVETTRAVFDRALGQAKP